MRLPFSPIDTVGSATHAGTRSASRNASDGGETAVDLGDVEADRFLAEDGPACGSGGDHALDVGVGRGADGNGIGIDGHGLVEGREDLDTEIGAERFGRGGDHIEHPDHLGTRDQRRQISQPMRPTT